MSKSSIKKIPIGNIKPYWRNPRNNKDAVQKVADSIERYGYNSFITVDKNNTIITGHTRHKALKQLNYTDVEVIVLDLDEQKAKEFRIVDNKTSEWAEWDENLITELREIVEIDFMDEFFEEDLTFVIDESTGADAFKPIDQKQVDKTKSKLENQFQDTTSQYENSVHSVICPNCGEEFDVRR